jgi:hypothetical protein
MLQRCLRTFHRKLIHKMRPWLFDLRSGLRSPDLKFFVRDQFDPGCGNGLFSVNCATAIHNIRNGHSVHHGTFSLFIS